MTERSRVQIPVGAAGEFYSPGSTFCADSNFGIRSTPSRITSNAHMAGDIKTVSFPSLVKSIYSSRNCTKTGCSYFKLNIAFSDENILN